MSFKPIGSIAKPIVKNAIIRSMETHINGVASKHIGKTLEKLKEKNKSITIDELNFIKARFRMMQDDVCNYVEDILFPEDGE